MPEEFEAEWLAEGGNLPLLDGGRVKVEPGDSVLGYENDDGTVTFTEVTKRVLHS